MLLKKYMLLYLNVQTCSKKLQNFTRLIASKTIKKHFLLWSQYLKLILEHTVLNSFKQSTHLKRMQVEVFVLL